MSALSMFFGIIVRMQSEKGGKHNKPHIHALYGDNEIVVGIDGEVLEGNFPNISSHGREEGSSAQSSLS